MDKQKMLEQTKILQQKKIARMSQISQRMKPIIQQGVVRFVQPIAQKPGEVKHQAVPQQNIPSLFSIPQNNAKPNITGTKQNQNAPPLPQQTTKTQPPQNQPKKGCGKCGRKLGNR